MTNVIWTEGWFDGKTTHKFNEDATMTDFQKAREAAIAAFWKKGLISKSRCGEQLDAALSAFEKAGLVLVPKEATHAMREAAVDSGAFEGDMFSFAIDDAAVAYNAMIAAAIAERQK